MGRESNKNKKKMKISVNLRTYIYINPIQLDQSIVLNNGFRSGIRRSVHPD